MNQPRASRIWRLSPGVCSAYRWGVWAYPQELANLYAFLASEESSYITGQTFHINGGSARY